MSIIKNDGVKISTSYNALGTLTLAGGHNYGAINVPPDSSPPGGGGGSQLTITEFSRDEIIFDSGAAIGNDYAVVFISGTATSGDVIEARAYSVNDNGVTSTAWAAVATTNGSGSWSGYITPPLNRHWYKVQVRLQHNISITAQHTYKFAVGHVIAIWGQSEHARIWNTGFNDTPARPSLVTIREQLEFLAQPGGSGRTSTAPMKIPGVDTHPSGMSQPTIAGGGDREIQLSGTGILENWYFENTNLILAAGANWTFKQCHFYVTRDPASVNSGTVPGFMIEGLNQNTYITAHDCTFESSGIEGGLNAAITSHGVAGWVGRADILRCRFYNLPSDAIKISGGSVRWCYGYWKINLAKIPTAYSGSTSYVVGDYVYANNPPLVYKCKLDTTGNAPPTNKSNNTWWNNIDPHVDCVTINSSPTYGMYEFNYFDMKDLIVTNGGTGDNNTFRIAQDNGKTGDYVGCEIRYNIMSKEHLSNSFPMQTTWPGTCTVLIEGNWINRGSGGTNPYIAPVSAGQDVVWAGNIDNETLASAPTPNNCTTGTLKVEDNNGRIQHFWHNRTNSIPAVNGVQQHKVITGSVYTDGFAEMANVALMERHGERFAFIHHTVSGTSPGQALNEGAYLSSNFRRWSDEWALHNYALGDSTAHVGVSLSSWYAAPGTWGNNYGTGLYECVTGRRIGGTPFTTPATIMQGTGVAFSVIHTWAEMYDYSTSTKWIPLGPHRFGAQGPYLNSETESDGSPESSRLNKRRSRQSTRIMLDSEAMNYFTPQGLEVIDYWTDPAHPITSDFDGAARFIGLHVEGAIQAMGLKPWIVPTFDNQYWESNGAYVEVWSSQGNITTVRKARGDSDLDSTAELHWTDVVGFEVNTVPVQRAWLVDSSGSGVKTTEGRVRIFKPNGGTFIAGDTLRFGYGGASGELNTTDASAAVQLWKNYPVVDVGMWKYEGAAVRPVPTFTNPL